MTNRYPQLLTSADIPRLYVTTPDTVRDHVRSRKLVPTYEYRIGVRTGVLFYPLDVAAWALRERIAKRKGV